MSRAWTTKELARLCELYPILRISELVEIFDRSAAAIHSKANYLELTRTKQHRRDWKKISRDYVPVFFGDPDVG